MPAADSRDNSAQLTRRAFLTAGAVTLAGLAGVRAEPAAPPVTTIGSGYYTYTLDPAWGILPDNVKYGWGVGIVADSRDRIYVHSRSPQAVCVFDRGGKLLKTWGAEFAGTGHGLYHAREGSDEFLYFTDHPRNLVVKTDLDGNVVMRLGSVGNGSAKNVARYDAFNQPTDLAVNPRNGDLYVCEGYGGNILHQFTKDGKLKQIIGTPGSGPGQYQTPHGIWVDTRKKNAGEPEIYVADRGNRRIQVLTLDGRVKRTFGSTAAADIVRAPCCFSTFGDALFIPDLESRVTVLDKNDRVAAHLGDGKNKPPSDATFQAPHALCLDSHGDLYVIEWLPYARPRRFRHTPQAG
jgi:DNA-binding beta-propeller fold protein YncE